MALRCRNHPRSAASSFQRNCLHRLALRNRSPGCRFPRFGWRTPSCSGDRKRSVCFCGACVPHPGFLPRAPLTLIYQPRKKFPISKRRGCDVILFFPFLRLSLPLSLFPPITFSGISQLLSLCLLFGSACICLLSVLLGEGGGKSFLEHSNTPQKTYMPTPSHCTQDATWSPFLMISIQNYCTIISQPSDKS